MADDKLDTLLEQLRDDDPKARRKAITQLVKHGNPEAIIDISNVYRQADEDPKVREAAAKALKYFAAREKSQGRLAKMLGLARIVLVVSLVIV
ncbi:MAG: HEAT repeat domain-containing protein, partial [Anaerolineales bacterium]